MRSKHNSIDGFSLRRRTGSNRSQTLSDTSLPQRFMKEGVSVQSSVPRRDQLPTPQDKERLSRSDIDESLKKFDKEKEKSNKRRFWRPSKRFFKRLFKLLIVAVILVGLFVGIKALIAGSKIFGGNLFDLVSQAQPLKTDENGRSNIVIFGTAEDDEGGEHGGANLTDSIMVISLDQKKKNAYTISIPRDLWVEYDQRCEVGDQGKINATYFCASDDGTNEKAGADALRKKVGEVLGMDIQYYTHLNFTAVIDAVNAVGGIDVTVESEDPRGILDRNFDWKCRYECYYVKYANGEKAHMDGEHALAFARARNASGGYGLPNGNFDREKNQQKVIVALRNKAANAGTLANPIAATKLIDSLGANLRTNFVAGEVKTLIGLGQDITDKKIQRISLIDADPAVVTTGDMGGQSIVRPVEGLFDYSAIDLYIDKVINSDDATKEAATITVLNGSERVGAASTMKDTLVAKGFTVADVGNAATSPEYGKVSIYKITDKKQPATEKKLAKVLGAKVKKEQLPYDMMSTSDFVVIVGQ